MESGISIQKSSKPFGKKLTVHPALRVKRLTSARHHLRGDNEVSLIRCTDSHVRYKHMRNKHVRMVWSEHACELHALQGNETDCVHAHICALTSTCTVSASDRRGYSPKASCRRARRSCVCPLIWRQQGSCPRSVTCALVYGVLCAAMCARMYTATRDV